MFVRWKNGYAYLVHSYRDDNGQPRQGTAAYLGRYRNPFYACQWWIEVKTRLDGAGLDGPERERIEDQLAQRCPRPTDEQWREYNLQERVILALTAYEDEPELLEAWRRGELDWP